jgi:hypothetical protein
MSRFILSAASLSMLAASIHACDSCSVGQPAGMHGDQTGWSAGLSEQYTHFGTLRDDGGEIDNAFDQRLDSSYTQLIVAHDFSSTWSLQSVLPYIHRNFKRTDGHDIETGTEKGIGDASLLGSWTAYHREHDQRHAHVALLAGVKFPTGDSDRLEEEEQESDHHHGAMENAVHGHDLALGSGSYDGIIGTSASWRDDRWFAVGLIQYAIRTEGDHHYRYANDLSLRLSPGYLFWQAEDDSFGVQVSLSGEHKGEDEHDGEKEEGSAMTSVYLGPACALSLGSVYADIGLDVPIYQDTSTVQIVPDYRVHAALIARF